MTEINMKITREDLKDNKIKLTIEVEAARLALAIDEVYAKLAPTVKISGFRPGKAPKNIVEKEVGSERFQSEVLDIILPQTYYDAIVKENLEPVGAPEVKMISYVPSDGIKYEAVLETMPKVTVPDITKISVKKDKIEVGEKEILEVLVDLSRQLAKTVEVKRPAKAGDKLEIDFEGFIDNIAFDGGNGVMQPLVLGSGAFIPGFEEQLEGTKAKDEKEVVVTFPKEYHADNLKGKVATFKVKVNKVEEIIMPELTDAFAKEVGPFTDLATLKADIKKQLIFTKETQGRRKTEDEILAKIADKASFTVPETLIDQEQHRMFHDAESGLAQQGMTLEGYLSANNKTKEELEKEMRPEAEKRVKIGMILSQLSKDKGYKAGEIEIAKYLEDRIASTPEEQRDEAKKYYESHDGRHQLENAIIGNKVLEYIYETCTK